MRSIAKALYNRNIDWPASSARSWFFRSARVLVEVRHSSQSSRHATQGSISLLQHAKFCSGSESENVSTEEAGYLTEDDGKVSQGAVLFLEHLRRVPRNRSVVPVLRSLIKAGSELGPVEMKAIFKKLDWKKKYFQALKIVEWLLEERPFEIVEYHYARWLIYLGKVRGYKEVESAFQTIPPEFQKEVVYCRLFDTFLEHHKLKKAKDVMASMAKRDIPMPPYMFNTLIAYCIKHSLQHKVEALLEVMRDYNIPYNLQTYNNLLTLTSRNSNLETMEKMWGLLKADGSVKPDFVSYAITASAYFFAGEHEKALSATLKAERVMTGKFMSVLMVKKLIVMNGLLKQGDSVSRLYEKLKAIPGKTSMFSYTSVMEAYGEAGLVDKAEEIMKEMEAPNGNLHLVQYNTMIGVYCTNGLVRQAEEMLQKLVNNHQPDIITHSYLLLAYLKSDQSKKAWRKLDQVLSLFDDGLVGSQVLESRCWLLAINRIIRLLAEKGEKDYANSLVDVLQESDLKNIPSSNTFLLKAYEQSFGYSWQEKQEVQATI